MLMQTNSKRRWEWHRKQNKRIGEGEIKIEY